MDLPIVQMDENELFAYERFFFKEICLLDTSGHEFFSIPLSNMPGAHFSCVQDTVKRLTEVTGRSSTFQWRNCIFIPIQNGERVNELYQQVFDELRSKYPSLFIRSYVYVVFIKKSQEGLFDIGPSKVDFQIYYWNTKSSISLAAKNDLFNLLGADQSRDEASSKVFIVSNPENELKRIQDANSDVIDAVRAYFGAIDFIPQTQNFLNAISEDLRVSKDSTVLLEGPARSGKTIIAMSLLAQFPESQMLLMNWYFYDALKSAFKVWGDLEQDEIEEMFALSEENRMIVNSYWALLELFRDFRNNPKLLDVEIKMREWPSDKLDNCPRWKQRDLKPGEQEWRVTNITKSEKGDYVFVVKGARGKEQFNLVQLDEVEPVSETAKAHSLFSRKKDELHVRLIANNEANLDRLKLLKKFKDIIDGGDDASYTKCLLDEISRILNSSNTRFFHHDKKYSDGCWIANGDEPLIRNHGLLICDEAQRLGVYDDFNEITLLSDFDGALFLCGDDFQKLNKRGDRGIGKLLDDFSVSGRGNPKKYELSDSVGLPSEVGDLVKAFLNEGPVPILQSDFEIDLLFNDDIALVKSFQQDPSYKKHFAFPISSGFYSSKYVPGIWRSHSMTPLCNEECTQFCRHKFIPMLSPISDPVFKDLIGTDADPIKELRDRRDLSREYKFFCAEQIMPNYVLSAYELISREVESLYLKIPWQINPYTLRTPIVDDSSKSAWIKRHLYVLMTRATRRLVINIENKSLYDHFCKVLADAGKDRRTQ